MVGDASALLELPSLLGRWRALRIQHRLRQIKSINVSTAMASLLQTKALAPLAQISDTELAQAESARDPQGLESRFGVGVVTLSGLRQKSTV